ncbi:M24 family metallopeptidase [Mycolicibacterium goodii]|uniref:M24 family metallopeptidase n=1 Tax=Mycolicibacterium goodii TaxID=134601 RepID=UPI0027DFAEED|nr:Xaa-Pro peptidase family protein [Mycolicibacterium goodii]
MAKTQQAMRLRDFDVLAVVDPANLYYLTGYSAWSFYTPQLLIVPADGDPIFYTRGIDAPGAALTTQLSAHQIVGFPDRYIHQHDCHPMDWITTDMRQRGLGDGTIAVEMDAHFYSPRSHAALAAGLPSARLVNSDELVNWVRSVKSPAEIDVMRTAGQIATRVMTTALEAVQIGVRQCDAVAEIVKAGITGLPDAGGDYTSIVPLLPTGAGTGVPHLTWSDTPFATGEATILELAGCYQRYHSPLARTVFLGDPPKLLVETAAIVADGIEAALAAVKPGALAQDVERGWRDVALAHDLPASTRIGYSIGAGFPPDWGEHTISFRPGDMTELQQNMTFHMILGVWMDGWGYELSESFIVTDAGAECLASVPRQLTVHR